MFVSMALFGQKLTFESRQEEKAFT